MAFQKFLLISGLFFTVTIAFYNETLETAACVKDCLPDYIKPINYRIELILIVKHNNFEQAYFEGKSSIDILINCTTKSIVLHSFDLLIFDIKLYSSSMRKPGIYFYSNKTYNIEEETVTFDFDDVLLPDTYVLVMHYVLSIPDNMGIFTTSYVNEKEDTKWLAATVFQQQSGARRVFPCWDEPTFRATFEITVYHPPNYTIMSNMPIETESYNDTHIQTTFRKTPEIPTYLLAIVMWFNDSLVCVPILNETINICCREHLVQYTNYTSVIIKSIHFPYHEEWSKLNISKVDYLAVPNYNYTSMKNLGLVLYREEDLIYNEELDHVARKIEVARSTARKIIYSWFGYTDINSLYWLHLWYKVGFVTFFEAYAVDKAFPDYRMMDLFVVQVQQDSLRLDVGPGIKYFAEGHEYVHESLCGRCDKNILNTLFLVSFIVIAPNMFRMLYYGLYDIVFWYALQNYIERVRHYEYTSYDTLWHAMQLSLNKRESVNRIFNVEYVMNFVTHQKTYPVLNVRQNDVKYFHFTMLVNETINGLPTNSWLLPLTCTTMKDFCFTKRCIYKDIVWLTPLHPDYYYMNLIHDESDFVIVNLQQIGYYRVNYDTNNWQKIVRYLNSENYKKIHILNRAQIIDDAFHLMIARKLNSSIFWNLTTYLLRETDYVAWYPMFKALEYMSRIFSYQTGTIKKLMMEIVHKLLENITYTESREEHDLTKCLRQEAVRWACTFEDFACTSTAFNHMYEHRESVKAKLEKKDKLLVGSHELTYCNGLKNEDLYTRDKLLKLYEGKVDRKFLELLPCFNDYYTMRQNFLLIASENHNLNISESDRAYIILFMVARRAKDIEIFQFILDNLETIKPRHVSSIAMLTVLINHVVSTDQLRKIRQFVKTNVKINGTNTFMEHDEELPYEGTTCVLNITVHQIQYVLHKLNARTIQIKKKANFLQSLGDPIVTLKKQDTKYMSNQMGGK